MTKTKLKIISEADKYLPFEKGMRGRVPTCLKDIVNPTKIIQTHDLKHESKTYYILKYK